MSNDQKTPTTRPVRRRILAAQRKAAKHHGRPQPKPDPAGNRTTRRSYLRHSHKQGKTPESLNFTPRKEYALKMKLRKQTAKRIRRKAARRSSPTP